MSSGCFILYLGLAWEERKRCLATVYEAQLPGLNFMSNEVYIFYHYANNKAILDYWQPSS